jgi:hypothetical protein
MKSLVISLIVAHFIGDWILQSREMALKKSKNFRVLANHLWIMAAPLVLVGIIFNLSRVAFAIYIFSHLLIDWFLPKLYLSIRGENAYDYYESGADYKEDYYFWSTIAIDQMLHIVILMALFL